MMQDPHHDTLMSTTCSTSGAASPPLGAAAFVSFPLRPTTPQHPPQPQMDHHGISALDLAPSSRCNNNNLLEDVTQILQQQRLQCIDGEMHELSHRMHELEEIRRRQQQQSRRPPDYSEQIQAIDEQMRHMQDVFARCFASTTTGSSSNTTDGNETTTTAAADQDMVHVLQNKEKEEEEEDKERDLPEEEQEEADAPERTMVITEEALREHEKEHPPKLEHNNKTKQKKEEETEATDSVDSALQEDDPQEPSDETSQSKGSSFKRRLFGRHRKKSPGRTSMKKAYMERIDQEISCMKDELRELELSGLLPSSSDTNKNNISSSKAPRSRSKSPSSWGPSMLRKKSPPRKKARNRSPGR